MGLLRWLLGIKPEDETDVERERREERDKKHQDEIDQMRVDKLYRGHRGKYD